MDVAKPGDLYVGVIEFFAVLLPGGLLMAAAVVAVPPAYSAFLQPLLATPEARWVAFAVAAYVLGALVFLPASKIDDWLYNGYRKRRWPLSADFAYPLATRLRQQALPESAEVDDPMNTFAWSKALLLLLAPGAFNEVQRYEAESKFFRSLIIVLPLMGLLSLVKAPPLVLLATLALAGLSFLRYAEQRHKSTEWAYRYVIALQMGSATLSGGARKVPAG